MQCPDCVKLLYAYMDDELGREERLLVASHLKTCEACQKDWHEIQQALAAYRGEFAAISASPGFTGRVMASLPEESQSALAFLPVTAIGLLLAGSAVIYAVFSPLIYPILRLLYRLLMSLAPLPAMILPAFPLLLYGGMAVLAVSFLILTWTTRKVVLS